MKLMDILNMISKGELKEGTKVIYKETKFEYERLELEDDEGYSIMYSVNDILDLSDECELIEPDHFADVGKMAEPTDNAKIEEISAWGRTSFEYGTPVPADWVMANKINEIIRKLNKGE